MYQHAFNVMKYVVFGDAINVYANPDIPFKQIIDSSNYLMGAAILQRGKCIAYWSQSVSDAQKNYYNTMEKGLLVIVIYIK